ncbi:hypothetical protein RDMS_09015 [Deinococcus sp. RL]|uniref:helix-turn-helix domain-containing protein n=1 Tax=Deinococcus sp. RL TaxID=1489678 RepID=UPI0004D60454|nr:helix-turn-helix transcriptional regulator [Deinococcus sp. RL]KEF34098.1 hypothetical protein RDMS_09015 [Deinococcus sp. RL]
MGAIRNALPELMGRHRIKQTALAEAARLRYATVNALYNGKTERVDFGTLAAVLDGLNALTGQRYTVGDLLEYTPAGEGERLTAAGIPATGDPETDGVLSDFPDILDRVARLERGETRLIPLEEVAAKYGVKL